MQIIVYIVLAVCGSPDLPSSQWYEVSAFSTPEKAQGYVDVQHAVDELRCEYSIHESVVNKLDPPL